MSSELQNMNSFPPATRTPPVVFSSEAYDPLQNPQQQAFPGFYGYSSMYPMQHFMTPQQPCPPGYGLPGAGTSVFSSPESLDDSGTLPDHIQSGQVQSYAPSALAPRDNSGVEVVLSNEKLWARFDAVGNEMVLTKKGRNPFPKFQLQISGLRPNEFYKVALSFDRTDDQRYKFNEGQMDSCGVGEPMQATEKVYHPDGIVDGMTWMQSAVKFDKLKLSNSESDPSRPCVKLLSMHKYHAVAHIYRVEGYNPVNPGIYHPDTLIASIRIPHTTFVTVTAYQNQQLTNLKICNNNYARGFRADGKHTKRKNNELPDDEFVPKKQFNDSSDSGLSVSPSIPSWQMPSYPAPMAFPFSTVPQSHFQFSNHGVPPQNPYQPADGGFSLPSQIHSWPAVNPYAHFSFPQVPPVYNQMMPTHNPLIQKAEEDEEEE
ncbi:hypothetical protein L596_023803 [Steinernema carpocapsae]|uniref:T-box domain-containing protein n=1 Tax=Steinernema carpocapsae TaxID=34508 RepID=A0A4U5MEZ8_STECR|nr:hypothetical protein L596_023803 [Steinernema carpocapsae]